MHDTTRIVMQYNLHTYQNCQLAQPLDRCRPTFAHTCLYMSHPKSSLSLKQSTVCKLLSRREHEMKQNYRSGVAKGGALGA